MNTTKYFFGNPFDLNHSHFCCHSISFHPKNKKAPDFGICYVRAIIINFVLFPEI